MLFTLPMSLQPVVAFTDGMLLSNDWVVVPNMTAAQASLCLGRKAIEAFPHRHFKNFDRMQDVVLSIDCKSNAGYHRPHAVGALKSDRSRPLDADFMRRPVARLGEQDERIISTPAPIKRLK